MRTAWASAIGSARAHPCADIGHFGQAARHHGKIGGGTVKPAETLQQDAEGRCDDDRAKCCRDHHRYPRADVQQECGRDIQAQARPDDKLSEPARAGGTPDARTGNGKRGSYDQRTQHPGQRNSGQVGRSAARQGCKHSHDLTENLRPVRRRKIKAIAEDARHVGAGPGGRAVTCRGGKQSDQLCGVLKLVHAQHGIGQGAGLRLGQGLDRQLHELLDNVLFRGEGLRFPRGFQGFVMDAAILQMHLDAHLVAEPRTKGGDRRILDTFHLARQLDPGRIIHAIGFELIDEDIAFQQQGGHTERQVELCRGQAFGPVGPADMIDRHLRSVNDDLVEFIQREGATLLDCADGIQRGVVRTDAGIELERDLHRLEPRAKLGAQFVQIEPVLRA